MSHTPGPWHASFPRIFGALPSLNGCDIGAENGANVAIVLHDFLDREQTETVANARLIAAAPELRDALEGLLAEVDAMTKRVSWAGNGYRDAARAALAKAGV